MSQFFVLFSDEEEAALIVAQFKFKYIHEDFDGSKESRLKTKIGAKKSKRIYSSYIGEPY